jgi:hypothetical protein
MANPEDIRNKAAQVRATAKSQDGKKAKTIQTRILRCSDRMVFNAFLRIFFGSLPEVLNSVLII